MTGDSKPLTVTCRECGAEIDELAVFPKGRCVDCHEKHWRPSAADFNSMTRAFRGGVINRRTRR